MTVRSSETTLQSLLKKAEIFEGVVTENETLKKENQRLESLISAVRGKQDRVVEASVRPWRQKTAKLEGLVRAAIEEKQFLQKRVDELEEERREQEKKRDKILVAHQEEAVTVPRTEEEEEEEEKLVDKDDVAVTIIHKVDAATSCEDVVDCCTLPTLPEQRKEAEEETMDYQGRRQRHYNALATGTASSSSTQICTMMNVPTVICTRWNLSSSSLFLHGLGIQMLCIHILGGKKDALLIDFPHCMISVEQFQSQQGTLQHEHNNTNGEQYSNENSRIPGSHSFWREWKAYYGGHHQQCRANPIMTRNKGRTTAAIRTTEEEGGGGINSSLDDVVGVDSEGNELLWCSMVSHVLQGMLMMRSSDYYSYHHHQGVVGCGSVGELVAGLVHRFVPCVRSSLNSDAFFSLGGGEDSTTLQILEMVRVFGDVVVLERVSSSHGDDNEKEEVTTSSSRSSQQQQQYVSTAKVLTDISWLADQCVVYLSGVERRRRNDQYDDDDDDDGGDELVISGGWLPFDELLKSFDPLSTAHYRITL